MAGSSPSAVTPAESAAVFAELGAYERHFNDIQARYRTLASTWLLATFAGVGFLLTNDRLAIDFDPLIGVVGLTFAGAIGIGLLWNLDLGVYHTLLQAVFEEGVKYEESARLPRIRAKMDAKHRGGVTRKTAVFYEVSAAALLMVSAAALTLLLWEELPAAGALAVGLAYAAGASVALYALHQRTCLPKTP